MKKEKTIVIIVIAVLILPIVFFVGVCGYIAMDSYGVFENYSGWRRVEIPTESEIKATVKLPKEWSFVVENDRVKIKDTDGNVIATECYEGWRINHYKGGIHYDNKDQMDINSEIPEYYRDLDHYERVEDVYTSSACYLYKITYESVTSYAFAMEVMSSYKNDGIYTLFLLFDSEIDVLNLYEKIHKSYLFAGILEDKTLFKKEK